MRQRLVLWWLSLLMLVPVLSAAQVVRPPGGGSGMTGYMTVLDEGTPLTARTKLNLIGAGVTCVDNAGATRTDCTISGGASVGAANVLQMADGVGGLAAADSATFTTFLRGPMLTGGTGGASTLILRSTSGTSGGAGTDAVIIQGGNQIEGARWTISSSAAATTAPVLAIGTTAPSVGIREEIRGSGASTVGTYLEYHEHAISGDLGAASVSGAPLRVNTLYSATNPNSPFTGVYSAVYASSTYGFGATYGAGACSTGCAVGTGNVFNGQTKVVANGNQNSEHTIYYGGMRAELGTGYSQTVAPAGSFFAVADFNMHGPIAMQPGLLTGEVIFIDNYYNGHPSRNGALSTGLLVATSQGEGGQLDSIHTAAATFPMDVGVHIAGTSGSVVDGAGIGWTTGLKVGGQPGNWGGAGAMTISRIGTGVEILDHSTNGLYIHGARSSGTAIQVDSDGGSVRVDTSINMGVAAASGISLQIFNALTTGTTDATGISSNGRSGVSSTTIATATGVYGQGTSATSGTGRTTNTFGVSGKFVVNSTSSNSSVTAASLVALAGTNPAGTLDTAIGLYMEAQTVGTTKYQIYSAGTAPSRFFGPLDLSQIAAGSSNLTITATSDTPTTTWTTGATTTSPLGFIEITVGGNARYIPFYN